MPLRGIAMMVNSLPIAVKVLAGSAVLLISLVSIGALGVLSLNSLGARLETSVHSTIAKGSSKERMIDALYEAHLNLFRFMAWSSNRVDDSMLDRVRSEISRSEAAVEARLAHLAGRDDLSRIERQEVRGFAESWERYLAAARNAIEVGLADPAEAMLLLGAVDDDFERAALHLRRLTVAARSQSRMAVEVLREEAAADARLIETGGLAAIALALAVAFFFARSIISPIRDVTRALREISFGNLDFHPERAYQHRSDEIGQMVGAIATFCQEMRGTRAALERNQRDLRAQNLRFDAALTLMSQGLCMYDPEMRLVMANRRYAELYGLDPALVKPGIHLMQVLRWRIEAGTYSGDDPEAYIRERLAAVAHPRATLKVFQLADGRSIAVSHRPTEGGGWLDTHEDITEIRRIEAQIAHMARHDGLTDLPNRMTFREELDAACAALPDRPEMAVLFLDLDRFKSVNDTLGHMTGDLLLKAVAGRLHECLRQEDLVARLSGDEFAVLLPVLRSREDAAAVATRIVVSLSRPFELNGHRVSVGVSIGIAISSDTQNTAEDLLRDADTALYRAKAEGRGVFRFHDPGMDRAIQRRRQLELDLLKAIRERELELHFQPIVDIAADRVVAFEALLRWTHPVHGAVPPAEFIPAAESIGAIEELGEWVIRRACLEAAAWPARLGVSVNLSALQFGEYDLAGLVADALAEAGLAPGRLELEITESVLLHDSETNLRILHELRALGVRIVMDDFGTGYSSLSYLRCFPFDKIKIDRSFIREIPTDPGSGAIVGAVAELATSLGITTTAEGVERDEQLDYVRRRGCNEVQGFLFSPAVPAAEVPALLARLAEEAADRRLLAADAKAPVAASDPLRLLGRTGS